MALLSPQPATSIITFSSIFLNALRAEEVETPAMRF